MYKSSIYYDPAVVSFRGFHLYQSRVLKTQKNSAFENIVEKEENAGAEHLFLSCNVFCPYKPVKTKSNHVINV